MTADGARGPRGAGSERGHDDGSPFDPASVLLDVPASLWGELLRALRRAVDRWPRMELPAELRPYAGWTPDSLAGFRPRHAVARAVADDPRLREEIGAALDDGDALRAAGHVDAGRLAEAHGVETAVAALVARSRWEDLAVVAAEAAERQARGDRSAADAAGPQEDTDRDAVERRLSASLEAAREESAAQRRRAEAAEERARREEHARREEQAERERLGARVEQLEQALVSERRRRERRVARLHQRVREADARARVDEDRVRGVMAELERLAAELRDALGRGESESSPASVETDDGCRPAGVTVPRRVVAATPGRPCRLPSGVADDTPDAVRALLQVPRLEVVLDGYNVTKDAAGRSHATLADQRQWLVKLAGGVAARFGRRFTVVFDATEQRLGPQMGARDVRVIFTAGEEIADERIEEIAAGLGEVPVLVVSSDREVRQAADALGADVASAGTFLAAVDA